MSGYAIFRLDKITSSAEMSSRYQHNYRVFDVAHADLLKSEENIELVNSYGKSYEELFREELCRLKNAGLAYDANRAYNANLDFNGVRKGAVQGFEIFLGYSYEAKDDISVEEWAEKSMEWLDKTFNPEGHMIKFVDRSGVERTIKSDNVKAAVLHMDESVAHIHAFIVPVDDRGKINAKLYTRDRNTMCRLQSDYAKAVEEFGLKRGAKHSLASHEDITKYHSYIKEAVSSELPFPEPGENIDDFRERANEVFQKEKSQHRNDVVKLEQKIIEARSDSIENLQKMSFRFEKSGKQMDKFAREFGVDELTDSNVRQIRRVYKENESFKKAVEEYPDREEAERAMTVFRLMVEWQQEREREARKKQEEERKTSE